MKTRPQALPGGTSAPSEARSASKGRPINYYDILAVSRTASYEEIRLGYRQRIAEYHPDRHRSTHAHAIAALINDAWEVLQDEERRRRYDRSLAAAERAGSPPPSAVNQRDAAEPEPSVPRNDGNRRSSTRLKTLVTARLTTPDHVRTEFTAVSTCLDLSINGMAFTFDRPLPAGSVVAATLRLPGRDLKVSATVVRAEALRRSGRWKIAARFSDITREGLDSVADYLVEESRRRLE